MATSNIDDTSADGQVPGGKHVLVEFEEQIAWVSFNRPEKRNAISPALADEMLSVLEILEGDPRCGVVVLTGKGEAFSAGMDLKEYFREFDGAPEFERMRSRRTNSTWQWRLLRTYSKPTIAMVNGWCFGGAFVPLCSCDFAVASEDAQFGLSEINWGIIPGGNVTKAVAEIMRFRDALFYIMTGRPFDANRAREMGLINEVYPPSELRAKTKELALELLGKNPEVLRGAKIAFKYIDEMSWDMAYEYLGAKSAQTNSLDKTRGREQGLKQFLDEKSYRPGLTSYRRDD